MNRTRVTAVAHATQGLLCFHGFHDRDLRLLPTPTLYTTLDALSVRATAAYCESVLPSGIELSGERDSLSQDEKSRLETFIARVRSPQSRQRPVRIAIHSTVPSNIGLGSSAAVFAALATALTKLDGMVLTTSELSCLARLGSTSAAASVTGGVSCVTAYDDVHPGRGVPIEAEWLISDYCVLILPGGELKLTDDLHREVVSSSLYMPFAEFSRRQFPLMLDSIENCNFTKLGALCEVYALMSYNVLGSGANRRVLLTPRQLLAVATLRELRYREGIDLFFSLNTGSTLFVYTRFATVQMVEAAFRELDYELMISRIARDGVRLSSDHIF